MNTVFKITSTATAEELVSDIFFYRRLVQETAAERQLRINTIERNDRVVSYL